MADLIAIAGNAGSGKTSSIRNLDPNETFVISITGKPLPFKGSKKKYVPFSAKDGKFSGNFFVSSKIDDILKVLRIIDLKLPEIKNILIDDGNYLMSLETMDRAEEKGWDGMICPY